jgi:competence protein ComFC
MEEMHLSPVRVLIENKPLLCDECISQLKTKLEVKNINGIKILFLSEYDGIMKTWLMNFKEYGDIELAPCFLSLYLPVVKSLFAGYIFVPLPSSKARIDKRGFAHLPEILKSSGLKYMDILRKSSNEEQKNYKGSKRNLAKNIYVESSMKSLQGKNIVLFDDVMTSGATFEESYHVLLSLKPKKVRGLILMDNYGHGKIEM